MEQPMHAYRILVVDDEESVREIVCSMLTSAGYRCDEASDGLDALTVLESGEGFDLMLTGLMMPKLDGLGLLEKTKVMFPQLPVVMLTSVRDSDVREAALKRGAADYLLKPCTQEELLRSISHALTGLAKHHVLIADHEPVVADLINSLLKEDGYKTMVVYSSSDAIQRAVTFRPNLVIIDPIMPGLSGVEAATKIAKSTRSKILFLTTLASDRDFRELLRGIRQQGLDCDALPKPFTKEQLVTFVRRELGPVVVLTDAMEVADGRSSSAIGSSGGSFPKAAAAPALAREPIADYEPLFAVSNVRVYETNAFRLTGLDVDASLRDLAKEAEKLEMANKLGVKHSHAEIFPLRNPPDMGTIKTALQKLKDPEQRLLQEFFWFWPLGDSSKEDGALKALREHAYDRAVSVWKQAEKEDETGVATHNLAVYYHLGALESELEKAGSAAGSKSELYWQSAYKYWSRLLNHHAYWNRVVTRIREIADPRLTVDSAEKIWSSLPSALLSINARLAVAAAERGDFEEAGKQRRLMFATGLGEQYAIAALRRAFRSIREDVTRLCSNAESEARANAEAANLIVRKLFTDKRRLLQAFNYLLGAGDQMRDAVFDLVAQTGRSCLVAYANETEDWATAQMLFEECLALAEGKSLRARLEEDLDVIAGNVAGQRGRQPRQASTAQTAGGTPRPVSPAVPTAIPSSKPSNKGGWIALAVIGFLVLMGMVKGCEDDTNSRSSSPSSSYTAPASTANQPVQNSDADDTAGSSRPSSSGSSWEVTQLNSEIEANKPRLRLMESDLQTSQETIDSQKVQIDSDKARLRQMERDHEMGLAIDESQYETVRERHNSTVTMYNDGIAEYNRKLAEYKALLRITNAKIERYNALIRSR